MNDHKSFLNSDYMYMVIKSRDYISKMSIVKKLSTVLYRVHVYVHIKKLSLRAAVVANRSITISIAKGSDRWICSIIRHSRHFSSIKALGAV